MKLSTTFVLIAAAFTGSADAAKIIQGNLYADVFAGANEDPAAASPKESAVVVDISVQEEPAPAADPAELQLEECVSSCSVLGKPNKRSVPSTSRNDIEAGLKGCLETCYDIASNSDAIVKNRLTNQVPIDVALRCAETAAKKYRQVSGKCNTMKSIKCKSCGSGDCGDCKGLTDPDELKKCESKVKKCENKVKKCEKEYDDCTKCASQARRARSSVKRVAKELDKCIAGVEDTESAIEIAPSAVVADISVQEEPAPSADPAAPAADPAEVELEECVSSCSVLKKPSRKKATKVSESDIATGLQGCIDVCYENEDATVKNRLMNAVPKSVALRCAQTAAGKYKEVGKKCSTMKSIRCKSCGSGDCGGLVDDELKKCEKKVEKCEKEYDQCTKCASEARQARNSVKKVAKELDKCFAGVSPSVVKIA